MGEIGSYRTNTYFLCKKKFGSKAGLWMHFSHAKVHRRNTPEYHNQGYLQNPDLIVLKNQKSLEEFLEVK